MWAGHVLKSKWYNKYYGLGITFFYHTDFDIEKRHGKSFMMAVAQFPEDYPETKEDSAVS